jgi:hypothetical protein
VVGILVLGLVVVYQQVQISTLSGTIAHQSSDLANPTSTLKVSNFTVTKLNATGRPVMYLVFLNNGTAPASSLDNLLIGVSGENNIFQSCYNNTQSFFPLFSNESVMIVSPLNCGEIGNTVVLTASVVFLTNHGTSTKVYTARTTITQSKFSLPSTVVVNQIGINTYVIPEIIEGKTIYSWQLIITNDSPTSVISINETALTIHGGTFFHEGCVNLPSKGPYIVSQHYPLAPRGTCQINNIIPPVMGPFELGEQLRVAIGVRYVNGTTSSATTTAVVIPPYVLYGPFTSGP